MLIIPSYSLHNTIQSFLHIQQDVNNRLQYWCHYVDKSVIVYKNNCKSS
jgi:hypothetical protein